MKQIQPFQKHWLPLTSIVVCHLKWNISQNTKLFINEKVFKMLPVKWQPFYSGGDQLNECDSFQGTWAFGLLQAEPNDPIDLQISIFI